MHLQHIEVLLNKVLPWLISASIFLSISTGLRFDGYPFGIGELFLLALVLVHFVFSKKFYEKRKDYWLEYFWGAVLISMFVGYVSHFYDRHMHLHHSMAYAYTAIVTMGIAHIFRRQSDIFVIDTIKSVVIISVVSIWIGFIVFLIGDIEKIRFFKLVDFGPTRYTAWSSNPNQLALYLIPFPVWIACIWHYEFRNGNKINTYYYISLFFLVILIGLLIRSDALFVVWISNIILMYLLSFFWRGNIAKKQIFIYVVCMVICTLFVKNFASGVLRPTLQCQIGNLVNFDSSAVCSVGLENNSISIGYNDPASKVSVRQQLWLNGLEVWSESPVFGMGPGEYSWVKQSDPNDRSVYTESHNIIIDLLTQAGIIGGAAWISVILYFMIMSWRIRDLYSLSVVSMMGFFTLFHNTRQPFLWFVLIISYEIIRRRIFMR